MELELALKITHNRDDSTSKMADFRITKDSSGPLFMSTETESKFILTGHLKGFRRENIDVEINEAGNRIAISGKKPVQEMVLTGWVLCRKEVEIRAFRKVFRIPERVKLGKIKAKLNDETSTLTIVMPKWEKGIRGIGIEEVNEEEEDRARTESDEIPGIEKAKEEIQKESERPIDKKETDQVVKGEFPETIQQKNEGLEDSRQVSDKVSDGKPEATKAEEFSGGEYTREAVKEKPEKAREEIASEEREVKAWDYMEPEGKSSGKKDQVAEKLHRGPEIESQASAKKVEASKQESDGSQKTESPPTEEIQRENLPEERAQLQELKGQALSPDNIRSKTPGDNQMTAPTGHPSSPSNAIEDQETTKENYQLEDEIPGESPRQEPRKEVLESAKLESHQEPEQQKTSSPNNLADQHSEETQQKEIEGKITREEISEEKVEENESQELEKQKDLIEEAAQVKKHVGKSSKTCRPLVVAGSALLVSVLVFAFHFIRAKKR
ncbi:cilia- and flagella-associated protein 251-like [Mangifera indica]|uniref:cilia- and flagella-associated protein 251-like n=1 Tax=Mangifera indica TaxID=29780 RepID=UPI001CF998FE|nr:cilia- and flagella-associated protein 251-like [Mangifera indica]